MAGGGYAPILSDHHKRKPAPGAPAFRRPGATITIMRWERLAAVRTLVLTLAGFACLSLAAFLVHTVAGFAVLGVLLLLLEALTGPDRPGGARR